jgi:hypothetical protein
VVSGLFPYIHVEISSYWIVEVYHVRSIFPMELSLHLMEFLLRESANGLSLFKSFINHNVGERKIDLRRWRREQLGLLLILEKRTSSFEFLSINYINICYTHY